MHWYDLQLWNLFEHMRKIFRSAVQEGKDFSVHSEMWLLNSLTSNQTLYFSPCTLKFQPLLVISLHNGSILANVSIHLSGLLLIKQIHDYIMGFLTDNKNTIVTLECIFLPSNFYKLFVVVSSWTKFSDILLNLSQLDYCVVCKNEHGYN